MAYGVCPGGWRGTCIEKLLGRRTELDSTLKDLLTCDHSDSEVEKIGLTIFKWMLISLRARLVVVVMSLLIALSFTCDGDVFPC